MTEVKGVGRRRRRRRPLLDNLRNRRCWEKKEEAENKKDGNDSVTLFLMEPVSIILPHANMLPPVSHFQSLVELCVSLGSLKLDLLFFLLILGI